MTAVRRRALELTAERQRAYSRGGNFHADADAAADLGLPGLVAQGMQVAAPAYGLLLDEWGDALLGRGELELRFVAMVVAGETAAAVVELPSAEAATFEVTVTDSDRVAVLGSARLRPA